MRTLRDTQGSVPQPWWRGRCEERGGREDGVMCSCRPRMQNGIVTFACARYECRVLPEVRTTSQDLIPDPSTDSRPCGADPRAFKTRQNFPQDPLARASTVPVCQNRFSRAAPNQKTADGRLAQPCAAWAKEKPVSGAPWPDGAIAVPIGPTFLSLSSPFGAT